MKKTTVFFAAAAALFMLSCSKDKNDDDLTRDIMFQMMVSVNWSVELLTAGDDILTSEFTDYSFDFLPSNQVNASDGTNVITGTWYILDNDNPDSKSGLTVHIAFETPESFTGLTNDWAIISADQLRVRLQYKAGETDEYLSFSQKTK